MDLARPVAALTIHGIAVDGHPEQRVVVLVDGELLAILLPEAPDEPSIHLCRPAGRNSSVEVVFVMAE